MAASAFLVSLCATWAQNAVSTLASNAASPSGFLFTSPSGAVVDGSGNVYVTDALANVIRKITPAGVVTTFAGSTTGASGFLNSADVNGPRFSSPQGIAIDGQGNLYVADTGNNAIRMITSAGVVTTIAGTGTVGYVNNAAGTSVQFRAPLGIAADRTGTGGAAVNLFVADTQNNAIRKVVVSTGATTTLTGPTAPATTSGSTNGALATALFALPSGIATNAAGTIFYVADTNNHLIRKIDLAAAGNEVSTLAGSGSGSYNEGTGTGASFNFPRGVTIATSGDILVADTLNHVIRSITTGGVTSRLAGTANSAGSTDGLALTTARFSGPSGIAADASAVYIVDVASSPQRVRKISAAVAPTIGSGGQPTNQSVTAGSTATFTVTNVTANPPPSYQWQRSTDSGVSWGNLSNGAISGGTISGATTATMQIATPTGTITGNQFRVIVSNDGTVDGSGTDITSTAALLTVNTPPTITNSGATFSVTVGSGISGAQVTATGSPTPTFNAPTGSFPTSWATFNTTTGAISGAPSSIDVGSFTFNVTATNAGGTSAPGSFTITVQSGPTINTHPQSVSLQAGQSTQFTVIANSSPPITNYQWEVSTNGGVTWSSLSDGALSGGGSISGTNSAVLTISSAPTSLNANQFRVRVTNSVGFSTSNAAVLTVGVAPQFTSATSLSIVAGQASTHTVVASGTPTPVLAVVSGLPAFATFDTNTGVLSANPTGTDASSTPYTITFSATNSLGAPTQSFALTVLPTGALPAFTTQPVAQSVNSGGTATFSVVVTGSPTPTIQWTRQAAGTSGFVNLTDDGTFSGTATSTLTVNNVSVTMNNDVFRAVATNLVGTTNSDSVTLTLTLGSIFSTLAGSAGQSGSADGTGSAARFAAPAAIGVDGAGNTYVADSANNVIRKITPNGTVSVHAGAVGQAGSADGAASVARFRGPSGIAVDSNGFIYVADTFNHTIRLITPERVVTTIAGSAGVIGTADGALADSRFTYPYGVAIDRFGGVYVADTYNHTIRKITSSTVGTIAGSAGQAGALDSSTVGSAARFRFPSGIAVDYLFNVYVADSQNQAIRKITSGGQVSTLAGSLGNAGTADGTTTAARFRQPSGVTVDPQVTSTPVIYVADSFNHTIRRVTSAGEVTTLGGLPGTAGSADGTGSAARFNSPLGIIVDSSGVLYIADTQNSTIRKSTAGTAPTITTQPASQNVAVSGSVSFTVAASGTPAPGYQWQRQAVNTSGFVNLSNNSNYSGVTSATLTVSGVTAEMSGDQFQVLVSNLVDPAPTSSAATLTVVTPPSFTSANSATFRAGQAGSFTITANSTPAATFSISSLPSWLSLNATTGVLSGTPPDTTGSPFTFTITANNGSGSSTAATQSFTLTVDPSNIPPAISTQPVSTVVNRGENATFTVAATGSGTLSYQWRKDGSAINGATSASLSVPNAQPADAGTYTVVVSNAFGTATSNSAALVVNSAPTFVSQPTAQTGTTGGSVTFSAGVSGGNLSYQWRKNGVAIQGATNSTLTIGGLTANDAGNYDVIITNNLGSITSSLAQLNVVTGSAAPSFTLHPASRTVVAGGTVTLTAAASAAPAATYQWRKSGATIGGATNASLTLTNVQAGDAANYDVIASNAAGSATSQTATLRVIARSYAGTYFGNASGAGSFAIYVRPDNTGVFLGFITGSNITLAQTSLAVNDAGQFSFAQGGVNVTGTLGTDGAVSGSYSGGVSASLSGSRTVAAGATQNVAGFYTAGASNSATVGYAIASANSQAFAVVQSGAGSDGGFGGVNNAGTVTIATGRSTLTGAISPSTGTFTLSSNGLITASLSGASEAVLATQRLANISSRARVGAGSAVAIAGFVISGNESKPVLIRAVGPSLGAAPFNFPGALATPKLDVHRIDAGNVLIATNSGIGTNRAAIDAAGLAAGAFALGAAGTDAAILTTLSPGNYTATVSSAGTAAGVALIEVYDLSAPAAGQKLFNISTRADAGTSTNALVAGVVVTGSVSKRVLIRGVGPGLQAFGLTGTLPAPTLTLVNTQGGATVATNTGFNSNNNPDASAITAASVSVGAFPLVTGDSALIVSLPPGNYTAQVSNAAGATGLAIIELYELP